MIIVSAEQSDIGPRKQRNEDSCFHAVRQYNGKTAGLFVVADGVSSSAHGEIASSICTAEMQRWWETSFPAIPEERLAASLAEQLISINGQVCHTVNSEMSRSASTIAVLLIVGNEWMCFNAGDSRVYQLGRGIFGQLHMLTKDHSCLVEREYKGRKYMKSVLTSCVGGRDRFEYAYNKGTAKKGDRFLVCTDGVYKTLPDKSLKSLLSHRAGAPSAVCDRIIREALSNGETDNISAVVVFCSDKEE